MTLRRLEYLQWFGFVAGGTVWFGSFLAGLWTSAAVCNAGSAHWGVPLDTVELAIGALALLCLAASEVAAIAVYRATRTVEEEAPPPARMKFFAIGAMAGNVLFAMIIILSTLAAVVDRACHQA